MCGIAGFIDCTLHADSKQLEAIASGMASTLQHRGPDDGGVWVDAEKGVALGHRRLSILDLSPLGHQPMLSSSGRYVITFNGEIYNFKEIRATLEQKGIRFQGHSDTEVLLEAIQAWGLVEALRRSIGMFACALWDRKEESLYLVRDRLGKKPLYYGWIGNLFLFGSELKVLRAHPNFQGEINPDALALFLRYGYVPTPYSIYKNVHKLTPGTWLAIHRNNLEEKPSPNEYWSFSETVENSLRNPFKGTPKEAVAELETLLKDAVKLRMESDVPLGVFLSGGIDSSLVTALMQVQSSRPVETFTIGFHEAGYNEAECAKQTAKHLGTHHTEFYVTPKEAMEVIPLLPQIYDEPFADSSQIPTYLVSKLSRQHVTVSLAGDGGDELFCGYNRYLLGESLWSKMRLLPQGGRNLIAGCLKAFSPQTWERIFQKIGVVSPKIRMQNGIGDKVQKLADILSLKDSRQLYLQLISLWKEPEKILLQSNDRDWVWANGKCQEKLSFVEWMMYQDTVSYLLDDILVKVDRASMATSLEVRAPFLDHRVVEFAWRLPLSMRVQKGRTKWILRQILYRHVPRQLIERPKMGFGIPIDSWIRGPLREWTESLLNEKRLRQEGFFQPKPIREKWEEHLSGKRRWQYLLWGILMFEAWLDTQKSEKFIEKSAGI